MFNNRKKIVFVVVFLFSTFYFLFSVPIEAAETLKYEFPCTPIAGGTCPEETATSPAAYIARFYQFALMIAGMLAFGMLIYGGIKYTVSRGNTAQIADAKDIIYQALWGVALLLGAYLILFTIDRGLVNLTDPNITNLAPLTSPLKKERCVTDKDCGIESLTCVFGECLPKTTGTIKQIGEKCRSTDDCAYPLVCFKENYSFEGKCAP